MKQENQPAAGQTDDAAPAAGRRRRGKNLTAGEVQEVCEQLLAENIQPTVTRVYSRLNRGSLGTINRMVSEFEARRLAADALLEENQINRDEVMSKAAELVRLAYLGNAEMLRQEVGRAHQHMLDQDKRHAEEVQQLCDKYDQLNEEFQNLQTCHHTAVSELAALHQEHAATAAELKAALNEVQIRTAMMKQLEAHEAALLEAVRRLEQNVLELTKKAGDKDSGGSE